MGRRHIGQPHHARAARIPGHAPTANRYYPDAGHYFFGLLTGIEFVQV